MAIRRLTFLLRECSTAVWLTFSCPKWPEIDYMANEKRKSSWRLIFIGLPGEPIQYASSNAIL